MGGLIYRRQHINLRIVLTGVSADGCPPLCCRQAAVAGSRSPAFTGPTGQKNDLAIIEVALFFRKELLEAAAAATAEVQQQQLEGAAVAEAQPVILVTNDNAQLQLAKSHGLPAFKLAGGRG